MRHDLISKYSSSRLVIKFLAEYPSTNNYHTFISKNITQTSSSYIYQTLKYLKEKKIVKFNKPIDNYYGNKIRRKDHRIKGYYSLTKKGKDVYNLIIKLDGLWDDVTT